MTSDNKNTGPSSSRGSEKRGGPSSSQPPARRFTVRPVPWLIPGAIISLAVWAGIIGALIWWLT